MSAYSGAWLSLALVLTGLSGVVTYLFWRSRGAPALIKGAGITLLPMALYLTGTLRLVGTIVDQVASYVGGLVFSPRVWIGVILAVVAVALIAGGSALRNRGSEPVTRKERRAARRADDAGALAPAAGAAAVRAPQSTKKQSGGGKAAVDEEFADIEAMLRKRGIS